MRHFNAVFNTTAVNRYRIVCPASTLESCLRQCWRSGLPSFISHDYHRLLGWTRPTALHLRSGLGCIAGQVKRWTSALRIRAKSSGLSAGVALYLIVDCAPRQSTI